MNFINLTPHSIDIFPQSAFSGLAEAKPGVWVADSVDESQKIVSYPSVGNARISTSTERYNPHGFPFESVKTTYGNLNGIPESISPEDVLIVSFPTQSMAIACNDRHEQQMWSPYKVVRLSSNTSVVLGCMGLSRQ